MKFISGLKKFAIALVVIVIVVFSLSGGYSTHNIDKLSYVVALGIDVGTNNNLKLSIQLSKPGGSSSGGSPGGSSSQSSKNVVNSVECSSIESGINLFNSYISKNINLSHCKVIVISEEIAAKGISEYVYTLTNNVEVSPHANVVISKCSAKDFLDSSEPVLEDLSSRYYEIAASSSKYTGYTQDVSLIKFFSNYVDTFKEPVAILGSVNTYSNTPTSGDTGENNSSNSSSSNRNIIVEDTAAKDSSYKAGETPISAKQGLENMGLAVFKGDKLAGELTGLETICHLMISNDLKSCNIRIPNPIGDSDFLDVNLKLSKNTKNNVEFVNGTPYISTNINVKIKILSATENSTKKEYRYYEKDNSKLIEDTCNEYLKKIISDYLYKTSKDYNTDIDGFGTHAVKYFTTLQEWNDYNWLENYKDSIFNISVNSTLKSGYSFI